MANVYDVRGATAEWAWRSHTNIFHSLRIIAEASVIELHTHNKTLKPDAVSAAESSQQCISEDTHVRKCAPVRSLHQGRQ